MRTRADKWDEPKRDYLRRIREHTGVVLELEGRGSRWASGPAGSIGIMASGTRDGQRWWLGLDESEFHERGALGLILLCQSRETLLDFALPRQRVLELVPGLGRDRRGERKFNIVRRRDRYVLQLPGERDVDMTASLGDLSWLKGEGSITPLGRSERRSTGELRLPGPAQDVEAAFFARVRQGVLEPLDPTGLPEGALVRVRAAITESVPGISALRRILAAGGPEDLPRDLAERHDHYAHGIRK